MLLKEKFHKLIDEIEDEKTLESFLYLLLSLNKQKNGNLYSTLSERQKSELEISYQESFLERNLLSNESVKGKYVKWL